MPSDPGTDVLVETHVLEYPGGYTRSVGPIIGRFLSGLKNAELVGARAGDGRVIVPPLEYDPTTAEPIGEFVSVGPGGNVAAWTWVSDPRPDKSPLERPFAFALIYLDGADTTMLHAVDVDGPEAMAIGLRVEPRWRAERVGSIRDIDAFVPEGTAGPTPRSSESTGGEREPVTGITSPVRLTYEINAGVAQSTYLHGLARGVIIGQRAQDSEDVYVPPRGTDPTTGALTEIDVEVSTTGTITTFCVVNVPGLSELAPEIPYVCAQILLDGGNTPWFGLVQGVSVDDVHMGQRVKAVWADELAPSAESIKWFEPTGEPDAPYESYRSYA